MKKGLLVIIIILAILATSCQRGQGYAVVLWSTNALILPNTSVVKITGFSSDRQAYRIAVDDGRVEIPLGRVKVFKNKKKAIKYASQYATYKDLFVEVKYRQSLPLRDKPDASAQEIYNLREGEIAKVLSRSSERVEIPPYKGYWYEIVTDDGVVGYTFGRYLVEIQYDENGQRINNEKDFLGDADFEALFEPEKTWRPQYFETMIKAEQIDLTTFDEKYAFILDPEEKIIRISTPETPDLQYNYTKVSSLGIGRYYFEGCSISLAVMDKSISVTYSYKDKLYRQDFVSYPSSLINYIDAEKQRRAEKYNRFVQISQTFTSDWGTLKLTGNGMFSFEMSEIGYHDLDLSLSDGMVGEMRFDVYPVGKVATQYDGAFTLFFKGSAAQRILLYRLTPNGFEVYQYTGELFFGRHIPESITEPTNKKVTLFERIQ
jgi:hypothetical protein